LGYVAGRGESLCLLNASMGVRWDAQRPGNIRVRSLFVDDLTSPVLRMLGTRYGASFTSLLALKGLLHRYNVEPFFFTSSINWIPSRYQEAPNHGEGDRMSKPSQLGCMLMCKTDITITLPFVRTLYKAPTSTLPLAPTSERSSLSSPAEDTQINTQAPLLLRGMCLVVLASIL
jgi:hypothetical protein